MVHAKRYTQCSVTIQLHELTLPRIEIVSKKHQKSTNEIDLFTQKNTVPPFFFIFLKKVCLFALLSTALYIETQYFAHAHHEVMKRKQLLCGKVKKSMSSSQMELNGNGRLKEEETPSYCKPTSPGKNDRGRVNDLLHAFHKYRTVLIDLSRVFQRTIHSTTIENVFRNLPIGTLAHAEGCHFWIWCTDLIVKEDLLPDILGWWGLEPKKQFVLDGSCNGQQANNIKQAPEVFVFSVPRGMECGDAVLQLVDRHKNSLEKNDPETWYSLIEAVSPGPRIQLCTDHQRNNWSFWNNKFYEFFLSGE